MDIEAALKRIRKQIKFARTVDAEKALVQLWENYRNTQAEPLILQVYAFDLLIKIEDYKSIIPVFRRMLELNIDSQLRVAVVDRLEESERKENQLPSDPDKSAPDFVEFMSEIENTTIFKKATSDLIFTKYFVVQEIEMAKSLAWHQGIGTPYQSWSEVRGLASKQVYDHYFSNKINMSSPHDAVAQKIGQICEKNLSPTMMNFYDDIAGDLTLIAIGRLAGIFPELYVEMWSAYKNMVFPCGWQGKYPDGRLCIFPNC
jgi:hypothetical protein